MSETVLLQPVILSGGSGTRLWPLSRGQYPKQLLALDGETTMLQQTALRLRDFSPTGARMAAHMLVVSNAAYRFIVAAQLQEAGVASRIVLEPCGRNTAPALTLAALQARAESGDDPVLLVMPADHILRDAGAFQRAVQTAFPAACAGAVVTFGITPERAETGYGYLKLGAQQGDGLFDVAAFVEKPDAATAEKWWRSGEYLWNGGIFMLRASVWLKAIAACQPRILEHCEAAFAGAQEDFDFVRVAEAAFAQAPSDSIDYAVMEHLTGAQRGLGIAVRVVPLTGAGWSDVGSWDALWALADKDDAGNAAWGEAVFEGSRNTLVHASDRLVACLDVDNLVVVETPDAVLVARRETAQRVKDVVARLRAQNRPQAEAHRKIHRPWGYYDSIDLGERFQVKRIVVHPGAALSLQMHHHRAEHWIVVRGTARVTRGEETFLLGENQSTYIPLGVNHRLENPGKVALEIIEVHSGSYLGEDDNVRFEDQYGRREG